MIPINADGGAELQTWKIVVNGTDRPAPPRGPACVGLVAARQADRRRASS